MNQNVLIMQISVFLHWQNKEGAQRICMSALLRYQVKLVYYDVHDEAYTQK